MSDALRILIVEDNALVAKFYRMALERACGFECVLTENVQVMLEEVRAGRVHLALLDVSLSDSVYEGRLLDGIELARLLKKESPAFLPILLVSAHAMAGDKERFVQASGADGYIEKPVYDAEFLVQQVRQLLGEKQG